MTKPKSNEPVEKLYCTINTTRKDGIDLYSNTEDEILANPVDYADLEFAVYEFVGKVKLSCKPYFESID